MFCVAILLVHLEFGAKYVRLKVTTKYLQLNRKA